MSSTSSCGLCWSRPFWSWLVSFPGLRSRSLGCRERSSPAVLLVNKLVDWPCGCESWRSRMTSGRQDWVEDSYRGRLMIESSLRLWETTFLQVMLDEHALYRRFEGLGNQWALHLIFEYNVNIKIAPFLLIYILDSFIFVLPYILERYCWLDMHIGFLNSYFTRYEFMTDVK